MHPRLFSSSCIPALLVWVLGLPALGGCSGREQHQDPGRPAADTPLIETLIPEFRGDSAFAFLVAQTDFGPRNPNSRGHRACLAYLAGELRRRTAHVRLQPFTANGYGGERLALTNIIASFNPETPELVLLCAHWDTRPRAERDEDPARRDLPIPGANDGASGVAVLLELARLFQQHPPRLRVDIVLFDGEDYGREGDHDRYLLGSRHFARTAARETPARFGILLDMVGDASLELPQDGYSVRFAPDVVREVWSVARRLGFPEFLDETGPEIYDDHLPLNEAGIRTISICDFRYPDETHRFWHTHQDIPGHCSAQSLGTVGSVLTHLLYAERP